MAAVDGKGLTALLDAGSYPELEGELSRAGLPALARLWPKFKPMHKLVLFKLLDMPRAMELYRLLPFEEKYLMLCGFPLQAIAPVLEDLPSNARRPFVALPRECFEQMSEELVRESRTRAAVKA